MLSQLACKQSDKLTDNSVCVTNWGRRVDWRQSSPADPASRRQL